MFMEFSIRAIWKLPKELPDFCLYVFKAFSSPPVMFRTHGIPAEAGAESGVVCNDGVAKESVWTFLPY